MADFLTTHATAYYIEETIQGARQRLYLVSPFLQLSKTLLERLLDASRRGVNITLVYGKSQLSSEQRASVSSIPGLELLFMENLHAKCYANERQAVIGSMNMYEFSEKKNREMSVLLTAEGDPVAFSAAFREIESIMAAAEAQSPTQVPLKTASAQGFCIRCRVGVPHNPWTPLCHACFQVWAEWGNESYVERFCHNCGTENRTSKARPLCAGCETASSSSARAF